MKKIKLENEVVEFYDSPETMSIERYQKFNKFIMIDNEVGSSISDYDKRMQKAIKFVSSDLKKEALQELENNRQNVYNCLNEYTPRNKAVALLVKSIGKKKYKKIDSGTLKEIEYELDRIGFTKKMMDEVIDEVKKK